MALQKTEAIILRRQEVRETSLLIVAYSRHLGKVLGLLKGVRGARAAVPWYLEPMTLQALVLYERRRSPYCLISSCDLMDAFDPLRRDLAKLCFASFCLDLVDAMTETQDPHPEIFESLLSCLRAMGEGADPKSMARSLEVKLLKASGLLPELASLSLSPGARLSMQQILQTPAERIGSVRLNAAVEGELRGLCEGHIRRALDRELKSRLFLQAVGLS